MPSLALSVQIRLCRLGKVLARYSEGNLSSSVIRLGKCQGADAQEQRCCSSQIPNHCPPTPPPKHSPPDFTSPTHSSSLPTTTPPAPAATHSKTISPVKASQPVTCSGSSQCCCTSASSEHCKSDDMPPTSVESKKCPSKRLLLVFTNI